ncbi:MAG: hypothetical protein JNL40_09765 [Cyclobacteriaceae bacterium]|nr:hypothetical protein [Cyclobacteriaceae bacterium]
MACRKYVNMFTFYCKLWTQKLVYTCVETAEEWSYECEEWRDEGYNECDRKEDRGHYECCDWVPCSWFCDAWVWVKHLVCVSWHWVANLVCQGFAWVLIAVCKTMGWIMEAVCSAFGVILEAVCVVWDFVACRFTSRKKSKIKHFFVLALENRSFDHMLGFSNIAGTDAVTGAATVVNGCDPARDFNVDPDDPTGTRVPVGTPADFKIDPSGSDYDHEDPGHEFHDTLIQLCGRGALYNPAAAYPAINNQGFLYNHIQRGSILPRRVMDCFTPAQLPILNTLAKEFAICDNWYSSMPGPTWPNRFFLHAATSGGLDDSPGGFDIVTATTVDGYRFQHGHIFDALDDKCLDWSVFEGDEFPITFALGGMNLDAYRERFIDFEDFESTLSRSDFNDRYIFIEPDYGNVITGAKDFSCGNSMHPIDDVTRGEKLIKRVYETIRNSSVWEKSALIITFDEHGGFYDHVAPPVAVPPGDITLPENNHNNFKFNQYGVRVPAIIVSPFTSKGLIDHTLYDHTSVLATIETMFGIAPLTERDRAANNFEHLFSLSAPRSDAPDSLPGVPDSGWRCKDWLDRLKDKLAALFFKERKEGSKLQKERSMARKEMLEKQKQELIGALVEYYDKPKRLQVEDVNKVPTKMQKGFAYVGLLKAMSKSRYSERVKWVSNYKEALGNMSDYRRFMIEAKLKIRFNLDVTKAKDKKRMLSKKRRPG